MRVAITHVENFIIALDFCEAKLYNRGVKNIHSEVDYGYNKD